MVCDFCFGMLRNSVPELHGRVIISTTRVAHVVCAVIVAVMAHQNGGATVVSSCRRGPQASHRETL